jgi:hypothetical protein
VLATVIVTEADDWAPPMIEPSKVKVRVDLAVNEFAGRYNLQVKTSPTLFGLKVLETGVNDSFGRSKDESLEVHNTEPAAEA